MARFKDLSLRLLERLLQAQVIAAPAGEGYPGAFMEGAKGRGRGSNVMGQAGAAASGLA
jgi:hypothetical protein